MPSFETRRKALQEETSSYLLVGSVDGTEPSFYPPLPVAPAALSASEASDFTATSGFVVTSQRPDTPSPSRQTCRASTCPGAAAPARCDRRLLGALGDWEPLSASGEFRFTTVDPLRVNVPNGGRANGRRAAQSAGKCGLTVFGLDTYLSSSYPASGSTARVNPVALKP